MLNFVIRWRLDSLILVIATLGAMLIVHFRLRRRHACRGVPTGYWVVASALLAIGVAVTELAGQYEQNRLREMLEGIAPTYALEMEKMGHASISLDTRPDDRRYLAMVNAQVLWEKANRQVSDIYTFRAGPNGRVVFIVDSETDYDRNGQFDGDREGRTRIGEVYNQTTPNMQRALKGETCFDDFPETDRWGTWVSAFVPLHDDQGRVEGALGVDFDAKSWVSAIAQMRLGALAMAATLEVIMIASTLLVQVTRAEMQRRMAAEQERDQMRQQLLVASRQAGMAEAASGVLHNIGNSMNSVSVSASLLGEKLRKGKASAVGRVASMFREHQKDLASFLTGDPKGKQIPGYLSELAEHMSAEEEALQAEIGMLGNGVDNIKRVIASQQQLAKGTQVSGTFGMASLLDEVVRLTSLALNEAHVEVVRRYGTCVPITGDSVKVQQILSNIINNARQALLSSPDKRQIVLTLEQTGLDGDARVRVSVADNGIGFTPETRARLFTYGFTTGVEGHGFGLHWSAIAAEQMGGKLLASSEGPGRGATFTLEIPVTAMEVPI